MKKILVCALVLVMCITAFVACNPTAGPDLTNLNAAKAYLETLYGEEAVDTSADYQRPARTPDPNNQGVYFDVAWSVAVTSGPATGVAVSEVVDGFVTVNVDEFTEEDVVYTLTATVSDGNGNSVTATFNHKVPKFNSLTVAEFLALEEGDDVYAIIGYVMASAANPGKTGSFVIADETGAIFSYNKFEINLGDKVVVWGNRSSNAGVPQINTTEVLVLEANSSEYAEATPTELNAADIDLDALSKDVMPTMSGKYYKISGVTLVKSGSYTNANYNDAQLLSLYTNDAIVAACADFYDCKVNVYGYVRGFSAGKYLTIQVTRIEWGEDYEFVPSTPETKVAYEKENLKVDTIGKAGDTELPTNGTRYTDTTIEWSIKGETTLATLAGNVLTVAALPAANTEITLTATIKNGDVTDTKDVVVVIKKQRGALENKVTGAELKSFDALKALVPEAGNSTTDKYLTIGYVEEIKSTKYGNMVISNADGKTLEIYGSYSHDGNKRFDALDVKPGVGDVVVLYGIMDNYNGTIQMKNAWIMQIETTVYGNVEAPKTPVEATIAEVLTMADGDLVIFTGTVSSFKEEWSTQYNNCTPYITDGNGNTIYVYRCKTNVNVGDVVKVTGEVDVYNDNRSITSGATVEVITPATPDQGGEEGGDTPVVDPASSSVTFSFVTSSTKKGTELNAESALALFKSSQSAESGLTSVAVTKIYDGNGSGGAYPNQGGFIKTGTSKVNGQLVLTFGSNVTKVEIKCHDFYNKSEEHPTNSNTVAVNGSATQLAPYATDGTPAVLTFELGEASNVVTIDIAARVYIFEIVVTFAVAE